MSTVTIKPALHATRSVDHTAAGTDPMLMGVFISLLLLGLVMVFSSTIAMGEQDLQTNTSHFWRHAVHVLLGLAITLVIANIPIWIWQRTNVVILVASLVLLGLLLLLGIEVNGSQRWISIFGFRMQPAEIAKLAMVIYAAGYLTRKQAQIQQFTQGILNIGLVLALLGFLLLMQPDFGSFFVITAAVGLMMFLGGIRVSHTALCLTLAAAVMFLLVSMSDYRMQRVMSFRDPWADPFDTGFQLTQALIAIGRGEILGVGLGASIQKLYYLPHANNDFILAVIGEELGLLGIILVVGLFALLLHRALVIARAAEMIGRIYAARLAQGIGFLLVVQAIVNIGVNLGVLPTKGLTLPFISYGGSSMLVCCAAMGLLIAVDRQNKQRQAIEGSGTRSSKKAKRGTAR